MTILLSMLAATLMASAGRAHVVDCRPLASCGDPGAYGDTFDWQRKTPFDLLDLLQQEAAKQDAKSRRAWYTVHGTHRGWVIEEDVPRLLGRGGRVWPSPSAKASGGLVSGGRARWYS